MPQTRLTQQEYAPLQSIEPAQPGVPCIMAQGVGSADVELGSQNPRVETTHAHLQATKAR